jgi:hypothetical protein
MTADATMALFAHRRLTTFPEAMRTVIPAM